MSKDTSVTVSLVQMPVGADRDANLETAARYVARAAAEGADIVSLPEIFCCPYQNSAFEAYAEPAGGTIWSALSEMAKENKIVLVGGSMPESENGKIYNTSFVFDENGKQIARHRKMHLFDIDVKGGQYFKESDTLTAGNDVTLFDTRFGRFGLMICFDIRFPELARLLSLRGAIGVFVPAAFNMTTGPMHWELNFRSRAADNQAYYFGASPARDVNGSYVSYANSISVDPWGRVLGRLGEKEGLLTTTIDTALVESTRQQLPFLSARRTDIYELKTI